VLRTGWIAFFSDNFVGKHIFVNTLKSKLIRNLGYIKLANTNI
jgi:hypothetical protein